MGCIIFRLFLGTLTLTKRNLVYLISLVCFSAILFLTSNIKVSNRVLFKPAQQNWTTVNIDLVLHSVYFDRRPQKSHSNATVIFMSVLEEYRERILGCEVDGVLQVQPEVVDITVSHWIKENFKITHRDCFLYCYDVHIQEGTIISVLYNKSGTIMKEPIQTEIVTPSNNDTEEETVMVCATGFGEIQHIDEWLTYQRTIGVKFIHLNVNPSFLINLDNSPLLRNLTDTGYITIVVWEDYLNESQVYYRSQSLKYQDCALRYQGKYKYMMVIDFDEYFIPLGKNKDVLSYAKALITGRVGSIELQRNEYYCKAKNINQTIMPRDGNLFEVYDKSIFITHEVGKSIHLMKALEVSSIHHFGRLFPTYIYRNYKYSVQMSHCFMAHLISQKPKGGKECR